MLDRVGLREHAGKFPAKLSGGQQHVAIVRAPLMEPAAILFDEPTSALNPERVNDVLDGQARISYLRVRRQYPDVELVPAPAIKSKLSA